MDKRKSLSIFIIFTLFLYFNLVSCSGSNSTPAAPLKVFTTSATGNGNLGSWTDANGKTGIAAADAICQAAATSAGLSGTYKAWISDSTTDAYCHVQGYDGHTIADHCGQTTIPIAAGPWVRTDGFPFGETIDKIINNGVIYTPAAYDEKGTLLTTYTWYFTGTSYNGVGNSQTCSDWTSSGSGPTDNAFFGETEGTTGWWSGSSSSTCNNTARLLCVQTGTGGSLPAITAPTSAKKVFVTSVTGMAILLPGRTIREVQQELRPATQYVRRGQLQRGLPTLQTSRHGSPTVLIMQQIELPQTVPGTGLTASRWRRTKRLSLLRYPHLLLF